MRLRPYQLAAVEAVEAEFADVRATLLVLATGLGKTVAFAELARRTVALGGRVLVIAHRGELLEQAAATLYRFGLTVAIEQGDQRVDASMLPDVVVASVATLRGKRLTRFAADAFALVVVDEAHHAPAKSYQAVLEHFYAAKVLGVTATPDRADSIGLGNIFASSAFRMDLREGISGGWLAPITLRSVPVEHFDLSSVAQHAGDFHAGQLEAELTRDVVLRGTAAPLAQMCAGRQTVAFTAGVRQARALAALLTAFGVRAASVDGTMTPGERAEILHRYRSGEIELVCNAMLWTEGFDAPETSCIALARPTRSRGLLTQMIGRGTRLAEGKTSCLVLDFEPTRAARIRLASPADVLAGKELPEALLCRVLARSRSEPGELGALIEAAKLDLEREGLALLQAGRLSSEEQVQRIEARAAIFAAPHMSTSLLLDAIVPAERPGWRPHWRRKAATPAERQVLAKAGFALPRDLTSKQAKCLLVMLQERRKHGLCSLQHAGQPAGLGLHVETALSGTDRHSALATTELACALASREASLLSGG